MIEIKDQNELLRTALTLLPEKDRFAFQEWAAAQSQYDGITRRVLYGHPYYLLTITHGQPITDTPLPFIAPEHRQDIQAYSNLPTLPVRWFDTAVLFFQIAKPQNAGDTFTACFTLESLDAYCRNRPDADALTHAELRTLAQSLAGTDLRSAAERDGVSYETKRTQLKSVNAKLGFRRQIDLVAEIVSQLLLEIISDVTIETKSNKLEQYLIRYAPRGLRLHQCLRAGQNPIPAVECGPVDGRAVVSLQSGVIAPITDTFCDNLQAEGLRFFMPIRSGSMNAADAFLTYDEHLAYAIEGIKLVQEKFDLPQVTLHAAGPAATIAVAYATTYPQRVKQLIIQSAWLEEDGMIFSSRNTTQAVLGLAMKNPLTLKMLMSFLESKTKNPSKAIDIYRKSMQANPLDLERIDAELSNPDQKDRLANVLENSANAILYDFQYSTAMNWDLLVGFKEPLHFIHGSDDKMTSVAQVERLIKRIGTGQLTTIPGMGRLPHTQHVQEITHHVAEIVSPDQIY